MPAPGVPCAHYAEPGDVLGDPQLLLRELLGLSAQDMQALQTSGVFGRDRSITGKHQ